MTVIWEAEIQSLCFSARPQKRKLSILSVLCFCIYIISRLQSIWNEKGLTVHFKHMSDLSSKGHDAVKREWTKRGVMISVSFLLPGEAGHFRWQDKLIQMACGRAAHGLMTVSSPASFDGTFITRPENIWLTSSFTHLSSQKDVPGLIKVGGYSGTQGVVQWCISKSASFAGFLKEKQKNKDLVLKI